MAPRSRVAGHALAAERALQETGSPWIVCAPIAVGHGEALGALTLFGGTPGGYVPRELAREIGQRAAVAIQNGRLYASALLAAKERQRVLSLVAHELKNPLGVILMGAMQALEGDARRRRPAPQRSELEAIQRSAKRMKKLVGDLLDLASIDAGKLSIKPATMRRAGRDRGGHRRTSRPLRRGGGVELTRRAHARVCPLRGSTATA